MMWAIEPGDTAVLMNWVERLEIRSSLRTRRLVERVFPVFERLASADLFRGASVLEVGCGPGLGAERALRLGAERVVAIDADPRMVKLAKRRLARWEPRAEVYVGDVADTGLPDGSVDVAVELQVLHHVIDWQTAIDELARVLRPGGSLLFEDSTQQALNKQWWSRVVLAHPEENRFSAEDFATQLRTSGLFLDGMEDVVAGSWFVGVAQRRQDKGSATRR
jgi:ubiquinone/menaquinone biosynthesis C-methylase UbiE